MGNNQTKRRIVTLGDVRQNRIVLADLNQQPPSSVFRREYKKAANAIRRIILDNTEENARKQGQCSLCRSRNCNSCILNDISNNSQIEFSTVVPFIGNRGTGKTSIMYSILRFLKTYSGDVKGSAFTLGSDLGSPRFITFDMIDANTLNATEDVMEIILSRMLTYLEDLHSSSNDFRELYRMIDELHEDLSLVYWKQDERQEYGLTGLQRIADSQKSIDKFRKLVEQFNKEVSHCHFDNNPCYLVIALDDIDMYQGGNNGMADSQFALLNHVYNHMRIPGLIVLMTYNEHILRRRCNAHFTKVYFGCHRPDNQITPSQQKDIDELTAQFMSKLFPQERRIYMPNYQYVDSGNQSNLYVCPNLNAHNPALPPMLLPPFTSAEELPVKTFMLRLIAHKTGVYFDAAGTKQHFFEPRNLRELGELFEVINSMEDFPENCTSEEVMRIQESNRQELLNYLYNQFALKRLSTGEYREFSNLSMLPIVRQGRTLVDYVRDQRKKTVKKEYDFGYLDATTQDRWRYSYGELLRNIYYSTRISTLDHISETIYSKEFVRCVLGTHSVLLNQIIHTSDDTENSAAIAYDSHTMMLNVIGSSIAGRWANEMVPKFKIEALEPRPGGSVSIPIRHFFDWEIPEAVTDAIVQLSQNNNRKSKYKHNRQIVHNFLKAFLLVGMFFTGFPVNGLKIQLMLGFDEQEMPALFMQSSSDDHICFNVMNFVLNLYDAFDVEDASRQHEGYLSRMIPKLKKLGKDLEQKLSRNWAKEHTNNLLLAEKFGSEQTAESSLFYSDGDAKVNTYSQIIERIEKWENKLTSAQYSGSSFLKNWDVLVDNLVSEFRAELTDWRTSNVGHAAVLPIQHFDMMYNIMKRLANVSYHDIPEEVPIEDILTYYAHLYESVAKELENQDSIYTETTRQGFADAFRSCIFYRYFTAPEETRNPFLNSFLVNMLSRAITAKGRRDKISNLFLSDLI